MARRWVWAVGPRLMAFTVAAGGVLALASQGRAAVISREQFLTGSNAAAGQYNIADVVVQGPTVQGYTGNYLAGSSSPDVVAGGLSFSNASGTVASSGGALQAVNANGDRAGRVLSSPVTSSTTGTLYLGFLLQLSSTDASVYRAFELHDGGFDDAANRKLQVGLTSTDFGNTNFGLRLFSNNSFRIDLGAADTNTNLFVVKFQLGSTTNADSVTVYRNPTNLTQEAGNTAAGTLSNFDFTFDRTSLAAFGGTGTITADEVRIGTTWQDATTVPEPAAAGLLGLGALGLLARRRQA